MRTRMIRRALVACDVAFACALGVVWANALATPAYAYVDPSVMTYTIQALAGVAVALSAVLGVAWRRLRRVLLRLLGMSEVRVREGEVHRVDPSDAAAHERAREQAHHASLVVDAPAQERLPWHVRLIFALVVCLVAVFTIFVEPALEMVAASTDSLFFTIVTIWRPVVLVGLAVAVALALVISLARGKAFNVLLALVSALALAAFLQVLLLNVGLPAADGSQVPWDSFQRITVVSTLVWVAVIAGAVVFVLRRPLPFKGVAVLLAVVLAVSQGIGLGLTTRRPTADGTPVSAEKPQVTMEGLMDVSDKGNVIVFVLDTFDVNYLDQTLAQYPDALDEMTGFTNYHNTVGNMIPTRYALATLTTGRTLQQDDPAFSNTLVRGWYGRDNLVDAVNRSGYSTSIYSGDIYNGLSQLNGRVTNLHPIPPQPNSFLSTISILAKAAFYRDLPWALKPGMWFNTDDLNNAVLRTNDPSDPSVDLDNEPYVYDDVSYHHMLQKRGLSMRSDSGRGSYRLIHLLGSHPPFTMDEHGEYAQGEVTQVQQSRGSLEIVSEYLRQLKRLGKYDDATIIITADHGLWYLTDEISEPSLPIFLVKPSAALGGDSSQPCRTSDVPTGHMDLPATILAATGGEPWPTGMPVWEVPYAPRPRYYGATAAINENGAWHRTYIRQWCIDGDSCDFGNWTETGTIWPIIESD